MKKIVTWILTAFLSIVIVATLVRASNNFVSNQPTPTPFDQYTSEPTPTVTPTPATTPTPVPTITATPSPTPKPITTPKTTPKPTPSATQQSSKCDPNYSGCVPIASDVDCAGGSGNGPAYVSGPINVTGSDIYDLDRDNDGIACE